jgi:fluoroacetyl-CoA thioesterase
MDAEGLRPGISRRATYTVTREMGPPHIAGILATSRMIGLIEDTCLEAVAPLLGEGWTTAGTRVEVAHVGTAWVGEGVTIEVRLVTVTGGRLLGFEVEVRGPGGVIGTGTHQRMLVERARFARGGLDGGRSAGG